MKNLFFSLLMLPLLFLAGCVSLGLSQSQSEQAYTVAAIAGDVFILSGKATPDATSQVCLGDTASYQILTSTRNPMDGVKSYAPADNAHAQLQSDGSKLSSSCIPVSK